MRTLNPAVCSQLTSGKELNPSNVGAFIVRIGFWGVPCYNHSIIYPPNPIPIIKAPYIVAIKTQRPVWHIARFRCREGDVYLTWDRYGFGTLRLRCLTSSTSAPGAISLCCLLLHSDTKKKTSLDPPSALY